MYLAHHEPKNVQAIVIDLHKEVLCVQHSQLHTLADGAHAVLPPSA